MQALNYLKMQAQNNKMQALNYLKFTLSALGVIVFVSTLIPLGMYLGGVIGWAITHLIGGQS